MQIFSINGEPIIASNTINTNFYKETYNYVKLSEGIMELKRNLFRFNHNPVFLNLRIHYSSNNESENKRKNRIL